MDVKGYEDMVLRFETELYKQLMKDFPCDSEVCGEVTGDLISLKCKIRGAFARASVDK